MMKPVLIVMSAGQREYRESMLRRIAGHYSLVLISPEPVTWEKPYIVDHAVVGPADTQGFVSAALRFAEKYRISGVFTYDEWCIEMAATVGATLGLPQCGPRAAARCRDKRAARESLRTAGVPSAASELAWTPDEALLAAHRIGYPVVVKPRALAASFGVSQVSSADQLPAAFDRAYSIEPKRPWSHHYGVLIEEYLDGNEISVDSVISDGGLDTAIYARKVLGYPPYFEEIGHIVAAPEKIVDDPAQVREIVRAAHDALGIANTVTHTELRLTASGPRIVEVNGRLGGDLIPEIALLSTGVDLGLALADLAAGRKPTLKVTRDLVAGIRFLYADSPGTVTSRDLDPEVTSAPWFQRAEWLIQPGAVIRPEPGRRYFARAGFAVVTAESVPECEARMDLVAESFMVHTVPLTLAENA